MLGIGRLRSGALPREVIYIFVANREGQVVVIKFALDIVQDCHIWRETMRLRWIALCPVGARNQ